MRGASGRALLLAAAMSAVACNVAPLGASSEQPIARDHAPSLGAAPARYRSGAVRPARLAGQMSRNGHQPQAVASGVGV